MILPSGKQYLFHYDDTGGLKSVVMPSLARHRFRSLVTLGLYRLIYQPPGDSGAYVRDFTSDGRLRQVVYPSTHRRLTYYYATSGQLTSLYFDWTDVSYEHYGSAADLVRRVNLTNRVGAQFTCSLSYAPNHTLVTRHEARYSSRQAALLDAEFTYVYDNFLRVASFGSIIGGVVLPECNTTFDAAVGRVTRIKDFVFSYPRLNRETIRDTNMEITRERDGSGGGRVKTVWFRFNSYVKFSMQVTYDDELQRLSHWRRKVGASDQKSYDYMYDRDGNLVSFDENGDTVWRYDVDENSNVKTIRRHGREHLSLEINSRNELVTDGQASYIYDADGFLIQRGAEVFEYNSLGQLTHAFKPGHYEIFYHYDPLGRLALRHDILERDTITQYFYGDVAHRERLTHIYEHASAELYTLYYDHAGELFALQKAQQRFYVALDPLGTPIVILNSIGSVVKQLVYDPLGRVISDSNERFKFDVGFQGGLHDPVPDLVFLAGRVYDPRTGRFTAPDFRRFVDDGVEQLWQAPEACNHYAYKGVVNQRLMHQLNLMTGASLTPSGYMTSAHIAYTLAPALSSQYNYCLVKVVCTAKLIRKPHCL